MVGAKPLISVIVPFYNIEGCVRYCMESLLSQTFDDYEIVCIDDGSIDGTGRLLGEYGEHAKVVVCHKENGGLSDARNYGLRHARGEYITFVDGDDAVSPLYLEHMVEAVRQVPGALVVGSFKNLAEADVREGRVEWSDSPADGTVLTQAEAIEEFLRNDITESAWACLAPRDAYRGDEFFPKGKVYEDLAAFPGLLMQFERVVKLPNEDYGYVVRQGTISRAREASIKQVLDYVDALEALRALPVGNDELAYRRALAIMRMRPILQQITDDSESARDIGKLGLREVRKNLGTCMADPKVGAVNKARICAFAISPALHDALLGIYERKRGRRS